jgi:putative transposase
MDVWSRRIVGWCIAEHESADVAAALTTQTCAGGNIDPRGLVLHSDNGTPMRGSTMISTLQCLGVIPSFSRPHVSDDNRQHSSTLGSLRNPLLRRSLEIPRKAHFGHQEDAPL